MAQGWFRWRAMAATMGQLTLWSPPSTHRRSAGLIVSRRSTARSAIDSGDTGSPARTSRGSAGGSSLGSTRDSLARARGLARARAAGGARRAALLAVGLGVEVEALDPAVDQGRLALELASDVGHVPLVPAQQLLQL